MIKVYRDLFEKCSNLVGEVHRLEAQKSNLERQKTMVDQQQHQQQFQHQLLIQQPTQHKQPLQQRQPQLPSHAPKQKPAVLMHHSQQQQQQQQQSPQQQPQPQTSVSSIFRLVIRTVCGGT